MRISKSVAILIGVVTAWPIVYMCAFVGYIFSFMRAAATKSAAGSYASFQILMAAHLATMFILAGLMVFYIVHVFKNPGLSGDRRVLWAVVIFLGNAIAMPVYWFLHIWRQNGRGERRVEATGP